ncbi:MAG: MscL family protein, partial [Bacteroidota bacterium]
FTGGIVSPLIGLLFDADFNDLKYIVKEGTMNDAGEKVGEIAVLYGEFLTNVIDFIIVAFVMFMIVKGVNKMKKKEEPAPEAPKGPSQEELLAEIRDLLKR